MKRKSDDRSLKIRLVRVGTNRCPLYILVVWDGRWKSGYRDQLGFYNPRLPPDDPDGIKIDCKKASEWLARGIEPSTSARSFLAQAGLVPEARRMRTNYPRSRYVNAKTLKRDRALEPQAGRITRHREALFNDGSKDFPP